MRAELKCDADDFRAEVKIHFGAGEREAVKDASSYLVKANLTASLAQFVTIVEREEKYANIRTAVINLYHFSRRMERGRVRIEDSNGQAGGELTKQLTFRF